MSNSSNVQNQKIQNGNYLTEMTRQHGREVNRVKLDHEANMEKSGDRHEKAVKDRTKAYEIDLGATNERFDEELAKIQKVKADRLKAEHSAGEKEVADVRASYQKQVDDMRMNGEKTLGRLREDLEEARQEILRKDAKKHADLA